MPMTAARRREDRVGVADRRAQHDVAALLAPAEIDPQAGKSQPRSRASATQASTTLHSALAPLRADRGQRAHDEEAGKTYADRQRQPPQPQLASPRRGGVELCRSR